MRCFKLTSVIDCACCNGQELKQCFLMDRQRQIKILQVFFIVVVFFVAICCKVHNYIIDFKVTSMKIKKLLKTINLRHVISQADFAVTHASVATDTCKNIQLTNYST